MINVVIDTNVLISAALSPEGNPAKINALISSNSELNVFYSADILSEYEKVLSYDRLKIPAETQLSIVRALKDFGKLITPEVSTIPLPDESDRVFYDAAKVSEAFLITGNTKHYPAEPFVITPADFIKYIEMLELTKQWEAEENYAFQGWDFSHLDGRWDEPDPSWDYPTIVKTYLKDSDILLDMGTGGGEVLLSIGHPYKSTYATESYQPNFELCNKVLSPLGITVVQTFNDEARLDKLPFDDSFFDVIINRHESFDLTEVNRTLKCGGFFITQQVGNKNTREFIKRLNDGFTFDLPFHTIEKYAESLNDLGFDIVKTDESIYPVKVFDVGALVFMAKIIVWEYPGFSVKTHLEKLLDCHKEINEKGFLEATGHRFLIVARKGK